MHVTALTLNAERITAILNQHIGSLERRRHWTRRFIPLPSEY